MKLVLGSVLLVLLQIASCLPCDTENGWVKLGDQYCYKLYNEFVQREESQAICNQDATPGDDSKLVLIKSRVEQEFITDYVYNQLGTEDPVWIGATRDLTIETEFYWDDGKLLDYTNWAQGFPTNNSDRKCVRMISEVGLSDGSRRESVKGQWTDISCTSRGIVLCQRLQDLSVRQLHQLVLQIKANLVPVGFLYTQFPNHPTPQEIWPAFEWENISPEFAGLFFRTEGGGADEFGVVQGASCPRLTNVRCEKSESFPIDIVLNQNGWSPYVLTGSFGEGALGIGFHIQNYEIKPTNTAIRVWKRVN